MSVCFVCLYVCVRMRTHDQGKMIMGITLDLERTITQRSPALAT